MILADKIIKLRKQFGWSQEELAEKTGVSRQSVSKWEGAQSIPDLNKIIGLADLFGVTTDFLLKDDVETTEFIDGSPESSVKQISLEQGLDYIETKLEMAGLNVKGVALCVCSPSVLFFLLAMVSSGQFDLSSELAAAAGIITILILVSIAVSFFIRSNQYESDIAPIENEKFELAYGVHGVFTDKLRAFRSTYNRKLSMGVGMFILSAIPFLAVAILVHSEAMVLLMLPVMLLIISAGLAIVIPVSAKSEAYKLLLSEGDREAGKTETEKDAEKLAAFYWPMLTAIYLGWSFWTMNWGITWIVWPVGAVAFGALVGLMGLIKKDTPG